MRREAFKILKQNVEEGIEVGHKGEEAADFQKDQICPFFQN